MSSSIEEARFRRQLEGSALNRSLTKLTLPPLAAAPSLQGLHLEPSPAREPTYDDVAEHFREEVRERVPRVEVPPGEGIAYDDWVTLTVVGYARGKLVAEVVMEETSSFFDRDTILPGVGERIVGAPVGSDVELVAAFPEDFPVAALRAQPVSLSIRVHSAERPQPPKAEAGSPAFFRALGFAETDPEKLMLAVQGELREQAEAQAQRDTVDRVWDALCARTPVEIPDEAVDAVLGAQWSEAQGQSLLRMGLSSEDRETAAQRWLEDSTLRAHARRHLHIDLILAAVAQAEGLATFDEAQTRQWLGAFARPSGASVDEVLARLREDPELARRTHVQLTAMRTAEFIIEAVLRG